MRAHVTRCAKMHESDGALLTPDEVFPNVEFRLAMLLLFFGGIGIVRGGQRLFGRRLAKKKIRNGRRPFGGIDLPRLLSEGLRVALSCILPGKMQPEHRVGIGGNEAQSLLKIIGSVYEAG